MPILRRIPARSAIFKPSLSLHSSMPMNRTVVAAANSHLVAKRFASSNSNNSNSGGDGGGGDGKNNGGKDKGTSDDEKATPSSSTDSSSSSSKVFNVKAFQEQSDSRLLVIGEHLFGPDYAPAMHDYMVSRMEGAARDNHVENWLTLREAYAFRLIGIKLVQRIWAVLAVWGGFCAIYYMPESATSSSASVSVASSPAPAAEGQQQQAAQGGKDRTLLVGQEAALRHLGVLSVASAIAMAGLYSTFFAFILCADYGSYLLAQAKGGSTENKSATSSGGSGGSGSGFSISKLFGATSHHPVLLSGVPNLNNNAPKHAPPSSADADAAATKEKEIAVAAVADQQASPVPAATSSGAAANATQAAHSSTTHHANATRAIIGAKNGLELTRQQIEFIYGSASDAHATTVHEEVMRYAFPIWLFCFVATLTTTRTIRNRMVRKALQGI